MKKIDLSPAELDKQSTVSIVRWVVMNSKAHKLSDENVEATEKIFKAVESDLYIDSDNRVWGKSSKGWYYPLHYTGMDNKLYGIKVAGEKKAVLN